MKKLFGKIVVLTLVLCLLTATLATAASTYTVKRGDTLSQIAKANHITLNDLLAANPSIKNPSLIYAGQTIVIPTVKFVNYTVQKGDTFWGIAKKFEISVAELKEANPQITNTALIYAGQTVMIPDTQSLASYERQVFELVNKERSSRGLALYKLDTELSRVARIKSQDMIDKHYFSHTSPTYGSPFDMMQDFGFRFSAAGENIAYGQKTAAEVMDSWMNSAGHKANILSQAYTTIGIGVAKTSSGTLYWTQEFINPY